MSVSEIITAIVAAALSAVIASTVIRSTGFACHFAKADVLVGSNFFGAQH
jgi:hypothetical protein